MPETNSDMAVRTMRIVLGAMLMGITSFAIIAVALVINESAGIQPDLTGILLPVLIGVALVAGAPHLEQGRRLVDFLISERAERQMQESGFCSYPLRGDARDLRPMRVRADELWAQWPRAQRELREVLSR